MKLRDKLVKRTARIGNVNPEKNDHIIEKMAVVKKLAVLMPVRLGSKYEKVVYSPDGVRLEIYKRKNSESKKLVIVIHGGAFILDLLNNYRSMYKDISKALNDCDVAFIDYRTAPEHCYPQAHNDVMTCWNYLQDTLGYCHNDISIIGDSAGGNLMLSLLLRLREQNRPMPVSVVAISPWTDLLATSPSYIDNYNVDVLFGNKNSTVNQKVIDDLIDSNFYVYCKGADRNDCYLSPFYGEYHDLPPMLFTVGSEEMLLDDTLKVYEKVINAGGDAKLIVGEGMFHVYPIFYQVSPKGKETFDEILEFLKTHMLEKS